MDMAGSLRDGKNGPFIFAKLALFMDDESSFKGNERSLHEDGDFAAKEWYFWHTTIKK